MAASRHACNAELFKRNGEWGEATIGQTKNILVYCHPTVTPDTKSFIRKLKIL
jgi:hypothetical protein